MTSLTLASGDLVASRYRLTARLGAGGSGDVWSATDTRTSGKVALKFLRDQTPEQSQRFRREVEMLARLDHPNAVRVSDYAPDHRPPFLTMSFIDGRPLDRDAVPLQPREVRRILSTVLDVLTSAHHLGIAHRDLKPSNIVLDANRRVFVADFGLSREVGDASLTATNSSVGTPEYWSPEQARGLRAEPAGDIYSLGVLAFQLLSGQLPFPVPPGGDRLQASYIRIVEPAPRFADVAPAVEHADPPLAQLVDSMLSQDPRQRPTARAARAIVDQEGSSPLPRVGAFCESCGARVEVGDLHCSQCGAPTPARPFRATVVDVTPPVSEGVPRPEAAVPTGPRWIRWIAAAALVGAAIAALAVVVPNVLGGSDAPPTKASANASTAADQPPPLTPAERMTAALAPVFLATRALEAAISAAAADDGLKADLQAIRAAAAAVGKPVGSSRLEIAGIPATTPATATLLDQANKTLIAVEAFARAAGRVPTSVSELRARDGADAMQDLDAAAGDLQAAVNTMSGVIGAASGLDLRLGDDAVTGVQELRQVRRADIKAAESRAATKRRIAAQRKADRAWLSAMEQVLEQSSVGRTAARQAFRVEIPKCNFDRAQELTGEALTARGSAQEALDRVPAGVHSEVVNLARAMLDESNLSNQLRQDAIVADQTEWDTRHVGGKAPRCKRLTKTSLAINRGDLAAARAKRSFARAFNGIARRYGFRVWSESAL